MTSYFCKWTYNNFYNCLFLSTLVSILVALFLALVQADDVFILCQLGKQLSQSTSPDLFELLKIYGDVGGDSDVWNQTILDK